MEPVLQKLRPSSNDLHVVLAKNHSPFSQKTVVLTEKEYLELKWEVGNWKSRYTRALEREKVLKEEVEDFKARVRDLKQRLYGKKIEKSSKPNEGKKNESKRKRGQQKGAPGHGRTERPHLPVVEETLDLKDDEKQCPICGKPYLPFPKTEDSEITEIEVKAHIRKIKRQQYTSSCDCEECKGIITAPPAPRVIPKSSLGVSVWTGALLDKFLYSRPTHRFIQDMDHHGFPLAQGTLTDGLKKLAPLFEPLVKAMLEKQMTERLFHVDETGWKVFEKIVGKVGYKWYLWLMQSTSVVFYRMAPGRGADVPKEHFAGLAKESTEVILVCDRYVAYKCLANSNAVILLAYCWAHVRRDFLDAARSWPELEEWMFTWVDDIRELYHFNKRRLELWDETKKLQEQSPVFMERHEKLSQKLEQIQKRRDASLQNKLLVPQRKVLTSLKDYWEGLTLFLDHPQVAMDNNTAERSVRNPVTGRKGYYGSGSVWSAHLAAMMFTLLQTVLLWGLNPRHWLSAFLQACAENGGKTPRDLSGFLPWEMDEERRQALTRPLPVDSAIAPKVAVDIEIIDSS